ncbi:MAG: hypothetical protein US45_C0017G0002 [Candidatus Nomurabacteria bacterium GW2011_GWA1_37_20]|uniref:Uncharacterized protein n=2 Tax=Parcubacteria group TaxID=1794811 RepID=A0A0G0KZC7_9BACT|nr:MAG: hypothetical protein US41_C0028G0005 [Parcubacteria group bacterium GW2011_GWB1_37_13]KKQ32759.1 MAG: hypothetical protein US45_C0017G0002 [Candidatus Nomurabacteria bacterium GW2011_GWA1_37_20]KKQ45831.1 MAG: hypothetical protein US65_C0048G0003 [Candidatus Yanofskybacteria bacterium GW2011_GWC2_37_9]
MSQIDKQPNPTPKKETENKLDMATFRADMTMLIAERKKNI